MTQSGHRASGRPLSVDDLGGVLLRINDRNYHDRISLLNFSSGNDCRFFAPNERFICESTVRDSAAKWVEPDPLA